MDVEAVERDCEVESRCSARRIVGGRRRHRGLPHGHGLLHVRGVSGEPEQQHEGAGQVRLGQGPDRMADRRRGHGQPSYSYGLEQDVGLVRTLIQRLQDGAQVGLQHGAETVVRSQPGHGLARRPRRGAIGRDIIGQLGLGPLGEAQVHHGAHPQRVVRGEAVHSPPADVESFEQQQIVCRVTAVEQRAQARAEA
jgi:hypothetical protein